MIIDSHAHAFPSLGGPAGFSDTPTHMRYVQHSLRTHHQPVRRVADNSISTESTLWDGVDSSMNGLKDVDFRDAKNGKFGWTAGSVDYTLQYLPPTMIRLQASPELMVAQMDYIGVDRAVLQTGHLYGRLNRYLSDAVKAFPDRFWALSMVDEWKIDQPGQLLELNRSVNDLGLHGLWFQSSNLKQNNRTEPVDAPVFWPFWNRVRELRIPVFWFVTSIEPDVDSYMEELSAFDRWTKLYPEVPVMFTHGLPLFRFMTNGKIEIPEEAWKPLEATNVVTEILLPIFQGAIWEYPFSEAHYVIREYYERLGPHKLSWGSDMPNVERNCTYKQSLDYLRLHCDFIPQRDMGEICGGNVARMFGLNFGGPS